MMQDLFPKLAEYGLVEHCTLSAAGYAFVRYDNRMSVTHACEGLDDAHCAEIWPELPLDTPRQALVVGKANPQGDMNTTLVHNDRWSEHAAPDGTSYYYDLQSMRSQWECPPHLRVASNRAQEEMKSRMISMSPEPVPPINPEKLLFIAHIPKSWTQSFLIETFSSFGRVTGNLLQRDTEDVSRGFGYIGFVTPEEAAAAQRGLHGHYTQNRLLHVEFYRPPRSNRNATENAKTEDLDEQIARTIASMGRSMW